MRQVPTLRPGVNTVCVNASILCLGANFSRRRKNPFKKLPSDEFVKKIVQNVAKRIFVKINR
jgi:hypothetical protein